MVGWLPKVTPRPAARLSLSLLSRQFYTPFAAKLPQAKKHSRDWLMNRVRLCQDTQFGKDHGFGAIQNVDDFRKQVPIADYEHFRPYIDSVAAGQVNALVPDSERLVQFTITTGSTGVPKLNPVTNTWLKEYKRAWAAWGAKLFGDHLQHAGGRMLQMAGTWNMGTTSGGYQISMVSALLARIQNPFLKPWYLIPEIVNTISNPVARHYVALRLSILEDVGWIYLMNAGTIIRLAEVGNEHAELLVKDIAEGTLTDHFDIPDNVRTYLKQRLLRANPNGSRKLADMANQRGQLLPMDYWNQPVIGCWTGGTAGFQIKYVPEYFGDVPIRDMGLVTSEGRHTIPIENDTPSGVPSIESGFYEFVPLGGDSTEALEGHELQAGKSYRLLMTTSAGYYRFDIGDIVKCTGFVGEAPLLEFVQKSDRVGDLEGEKVTEHQVVEAAHAAARSVGFQLGLITAVPRRLEHEQPHYDFLVEESDFPNPADATSFLEALDQELAKLNFLWKARRNEEVLQAPHLLILVEHEWDRCISAAVEKRGTGDYQYKHPGLVQDESWLNQFRVIRTVQLEGAKRQL